ncbi:hypothetical protein GCM10009854_16840 [Saccharopolyspora halophila]|uniref:Uncharacterized protein n=1 Tax=Saccharopolyspora halophila TaxID=405551 RepID=A0ABN3FZK2_9PSEU
MGWSSDALSLGQRCPRRMIGEDHRDRWYPRRLGGQDGPHRRAGPSGEGRVQLLRQLHRSFLWLLLQLRLSGGGLPGVLRDHAGQTIPSVGTAPCTR